MKIYQWAKNFTQKILWIWRSWAGWAGWATILCHTQPVADACKNEKKKIRFRFLSDKTLESRIQNMPVATSVTKITAEIQFGDFLNTLEYR